MPELAPDYLNSFVRERERLYYKCAGILPYRRDPATGEVQILLGSEIRKGKLVLSWLAGKREDYDDGPKDTAWREFWEESGKVLGEAERGPFMACVRRGQARTLWIQAAKQVVLALEMDTAAMAALPETYSAAGAADKRDTSMLALHWVPAADLVQACRWPRGAVTLRPGAPAAAVAAAEAARTAAVAAGAKAGQAARDAFDAAAAAAAEAPRRGRGGLGVLPSLEVFVLVRHAVMAQPFRSFFAGLGAGRD